MRVRYLQIIVLLAQKEAQKERKQGKPGKPEPEKQEKPEKEDPLELEDIVKL